MAAAVRAVPVPDALHACPHIVLRIADGRGRGAIGVRAARRARAGARDAERSRVGTLPARGAAAARPTVAAVFADQVRRRGARSPHATTTAASATIDHVLNPEEAFVLIAAAPSPLTPRTRSPCHRLYDAREALALQHFAAIKIVSAACADTQRDQRFRDVRSWSGRAGALVVARGHRWMLGAAGSYRSP